MAEQAAAGAAQLGGAIERALRLALGWTTVALWEARRDAMTANLPAERERYRTIRAFEADRRDIEAGLADLAALRAALAERDEVLVKINARVGEVWQEWNAMGADPPGRWLVPARLEDELWGLVFHPAWDKVRPLLLGRGGTATDG